MRWKLRQRWPHSYGMMNFRITPFVSILLDRFCTPTVMKFLAIRQLLLVPYTIMYFF